MSQKMGFKNDMRRIIAAENVMIQRNKGQKYYESKNGVQK